jgi:hypothetical protein
MLLGAQAGSLYRRNLRKIFLSSQICTQAFHLRRIWKTVYNLFSLRHPAKYCSLFCIFAATLAPEIIMRLLCAGGQHKKVTLAGLLLLPAIKSWRDNG